ncbi:MAG: DHA2 family efflux MFS transporter permease subunit [Janthinobacterium lividum]
MSNTLEQRDRRQTPPPDKIAPLPENNRDNGAKSALAAALNFQYRWIILVALILAAAMEVLDSTIINVALPQMAGNLSTTIQEVAWVSTGYILSNVVVLPMTAFLNMLFGRRAYLTGSIVLFTVASFFCGTSHSLGELIIWRVLQGAGGAALISTAQATLVQVFPPKEQAIVQPVFLLGLVVFPTIGPALGGWLTDTASWHWCFFINIPIGLLAGGLVFFLLHDTEPAKRDVPIDWTGIGLLATGLATLQYVLEEGEQDDWFNSVLITRLAVLSAVALIGLVWWELSPLNKAPVVAFRVLKNRSLSAGIILFIAVGFGLYGVNYLYPLLAQQLQGLTPLQSGVSLLPGGFASLCSIVFCAVISSNPKSTVDARMLTFIGIALSICGMWGLAHLNSESGMPDTFWPLLIRGLSMGFLFIPANTLAIGSLSAEEVNQGTGLLGLARQLGGSVGIAILATYFQNQQHINRANLVGYLTPSHPAYTDRVSGLVGTLVGGGYSPADAQTGALGVIEQTLTQQVAAMSFNDAFFLLMFISAAMVPTLLLLRKPKAGAAPVAMH